jgi:hypothetical protein
MENYYVNVEISGGKSEVNEILILLAKIQYLGAVGATCTIPVVVDGDGSGQLRFKTLETEGNLIDNYKLEGFKNQVGSGAEKMTDHWIGE